MDNSHMDRLSVGKERLDNGEAANIFGDAINRSEVHIMREIVPALDLMVVMELLQGNNYDLERSIDAALALMASLAAEDGRAILSDAYTVPVKSGKISGSSAAPNIPTSNATPKTSGTLVSPKITKIHRTTSNKDDFLPPTAYFPSAPSSSSRPPSQSKSGATGSGERRGQESRGVPMILSEKFLAAPRFRLVVNRHTNAATDFTIYFRRKTEKLGITIQEQDSEIRIHTLHAKSPTEPLLALESGIRIGDILTGVNSEYFSSGAEVQDIIDILHLTGTFVTLHFTRRYLPEDIQIQSYLSPNHKFARMLMDQTVINKERAGYVTKALRRLKERSLSWDSVLNSERIEGWKLDTFLTGGSKHHTHTNVVTPERFPPHIPKSASSSSSMSSGRRSLDSNHRTFDSSSSSGSSHIPPARHLRPAISVRVIRAEERTDHVVYVIWVMDVKSGAEWFVRRRFREFHDFKDALISIRPGIGRLDFPSKRLNVAEIGAMVSERLILLHKFIRKICGLVCVNSLHPSTIKVHLLLQQFLEVTDRMENITFLESKPSFLGGKYMVQVFVHSIMQMAVMDKVLTGFVDTFLETSIMDEGRIWNENDGRKVLKSMKDFIDNLGIVLYDSIVDDCLDILRKFTVEPAHTATSKSLHSPVAIEERVKCQKDSSVSSTSTSTDIVKVKDVAPAIQSNGDGAVNTSSTIEQSTKVISSDFVFVDVDVAESAVGKSIGGTVFEESENGVPQGGPMTLKSSESDRDKATKSGLDSSTSDQEIDDIASVMALHTSEEIARGMMRKREKEHNHIRQQCDEDEMRMQIRSAIRRQVEIEIFVPCSSRLKGVLERSFSIDESALKKNIQKIAHQPQSFFGIPVHQISPSSWNDVVFLMRDIKSKTLPHDKLEALLLTAKEIPSHFLREHPSSVADNVTLGADDFLPIFIYILARAQIPDLIALSEELQALCDPDKRMSETGYYLATLEASLQHIIEANITLESQALFPDMEKSKSGGDADSDVDTDSDSDDSSDDEDSDVDEEENDCNVVIVNSPSR